MPLPPDPTLRSLVWVALLALAVVAAAALLFGFSPGGVLVGGAVLLVVLLFGGMVVFGEWERRARAEGKLATEPERVVMFVCWSRWR
jgi:hypothetical protein